MTDSSLILPKVEESEQYLLLHDISTKVLVFFLFESFL